MFSRGLFIIAAVMLVSSAFSQGPAVAVEHGRRAEIARSVSIPPGSTGIRRTVAGKLKFLALVPARVQTLVVTFYVDDKEVGSAGKRPYDSVWDTAQIKDGDHSARWIALDDRGAEIANGAIALIVNNSSSPSAAGSEGPVVDVTGGAPVKFTTYSSPAYGIRIDYPSIWAVKDESRALPEGWGPEGYWLVFSTAPIPRARYVVNVRHRMLDRVHTADSFVQFTPYVSAWERTSTEGRVVFLTTVGTAANKRVIHRAMLLSGRHIWMMNCIDTSGNVAEESKKTFMHMVESLKLVGRK